MTKYNEWRHYILRNWSYHVNEYKLVFDIRREVMLDHLPK